MLKVLHSLSDMSVSAGGPPRTVTALTDHLAAKPSCQVVLIAQTRAGMPLVEPSLDSAVDRRLALAKSGLALNLGLAFRRTLAMALAEGVPSIMHAHGLWDLPTHHMAVAASARRLPLVVHPRGMLEQWALHYHRWKKRLALMAYQRADLESAALLFATAEQEAESFRRFGLRQPIAVIPNGVLLPDGGSAEPASRTTEPNARTALFVSRIHPKKGLLMLIDAWGTARPPGWKLCLAGPDEGGHLAEVMRAVEERNLGSQVSYMGEVEGRAKEDLYRSADLFVLPSFSENFGVVVAEALSYGLPVITTRGTPWGGLIQHGCGWWIEPNRAALCATLSEALALEAPALQAMGASGRRYVQEFQWGRIATQTLQVYRWLLGQEDCPGCVLIE